QPLGELDHRALAQVVGAGLEAEAEDADLPVALLHHRLNSTLDLQLVRWKDCGEDGQRDVNALRLVQKGAQVLRQARAAEGEAGLEVVRREVELLVLAEDL